MLNLYRQIWLVTGRAQILLIVLSLAIAGLAALPLQFQKEIVNGLAGSMQKQTLLLLCAEYLGVLLLSAGFKAALQYRSSILGESVIRRIRGRIYEDKGKSDQSRGTLVSMISSEAEEIGSFVGEAIAAPLMEIGTLVTVVGYIAMTQPYLGLLMLGVVVPQALIVVAMQTRINDRISHRIQVMRRATGRIAAEDIKTTGQAVLEDFDAIYEARRRIFIFKLSTKFVLSAITGLGTAGILLLGGLLAIEGRTDVGSVVAALSGLARISQPWRELIAFYRDLSAVRVKYDLLLAAQPEMRGGVSGRHTK